MESSTYILKNINDNQYNFISISKDMSRLQDYISSVENDLREYKTACFILFDLLMNNNIEDRFYKCYFDGNIFIRSTLSQVQSNEVDYKTIYMSSSYYLSNEYLFEDMFFTNEYKNQIFRDLQNLVKNIGGSSRLTRLSF